MLPTFNIPPIGPVQGKVWGSTQLLFAFNSVEIHRIKIRKGGYCSHHQHRHKWNRFVVQSGNLDVHIEQEWTRPGDTGPVVDVTHLLPGGVTDVPPGVTHWFHAVEDDCEALEIYWVTLDALDIDRQGTVGGLDASTPDPLRADAPQ